MLKDVDSDVAVAGKAPSHAIAKYAVKLITVLLPVSFHDQS